MVVLEFLSRVIARARVHREIGELLEVSTLEDPKEEQELKLCANGIGIMEQIEFVFVAQGTRSWGPWCVI